MPQGVTADISHLNSARRSAVIALLKPLTNIPIATSSFSKSGGFFWVAHTSQSSEAWQNWDIQTSRSRFVAKYHERWNPVDTRAKEYSLEGMYFHLYCLRGPTRDPLEVIGLHWHPNTAQEFRRTDYAAGLHVHVSVAPHPVQKAHLALDLRLWQEISSSLRALNESLEHSIRMIQAEILGHPDIDALLNAE